MFRRKFKKPFKVREPMDSDDPKSPIYQKEWQEAGAVRGLQAANENVPDED